MFHNAWSLLGLRALRPIERIGVTYPAITLARLGGGVERVRDPMQ